MSKARIIADYVAGGTTAAEFDVLDGLTSTTAELNILDGVTSTAAELNILDGVTSTAAELNHVDGVTSNVQTQMSAKAPLASPALTGTATAVNLTVSGDLVPSTPLSNRNMIINGGMQIDQRNNGALHSNEGASDDRYRTVDRYRGVLNIGDGRLSYQQVDITDLAGFGHALKIDCTTTGGTPSAGEYVQIHQRIEGLNLQQMEKGYSSAKPVTVSFWVKGTARTYVLELRDSVSPTRTASYQFSVTTSWVRHTATFPGDTDTDSKIPNDNTTGLNVIFWLAAGSNYTSGTYTATTWADWVAVNACTGLGANSGKGIMETTDDEIYITGLQLELGSNATPFEHRSYGDELARCSRYFQKYGEDGATSGMSLTAMNTNGQHTTRIPFNTEMRDTPTGVVIGSGINSSGGSVTNTTWAFYHAGAWKGCSAVSINTLTKTSFRLEPTSNDSCTSGGASVFYGGAQTALTFSAEL